MDWQQSVALLIVGLTAGLFVWSRWRRRHTRPECGFHCACGHASATAPKISVTYRARKGERPQIITRMH